MVIKFEDDKIKLKGIIQAVVSTIALAFAIILAIWIIDYFNAGLNMLALANLNAFLSANWPFIIAFVLLISLWDYVYPFVKKKVIYAKPLVESVEFIFGLWLVVVFLNGIRVFNQNAQVDAVLKFPAELFFSQTILIVLLIIFISYSRFLLPKRSQDE